MKSRIMYASMVALLACGMAWSQSSSQGTTTDSQAPAAQKGHTDAQGDLPAAKEGESQSGKSSATVPGETRPGAMGTDSTPNTGRSPKGETPATGAQTEQQGSAKDDGARPGATPQTETPNKLDQGSTSTTPNSSDANGRPVPSYEKPIGTTDSSTPSQKGTDSGTASPK